MPAVKRYRLRKRELKELVGLASAFGLNAEKLEDVEMLESGKDKVAAVKGKPVLFWSGGRTYPTLHALLEGAKLSKVTVDMGAVPHVASGADVMAPGVTNADPEIKVGDPVVIVDERHGKPIAVGEALVGSEGMRALHGKVVRTIHHVGDGIWNLRG